MNTHPAGMVLAGSIFIFITKVITRTIVSFKTVFLYEF